MGFFDVSDEELIMAIVLDEEAKRRAEERRRNRPYLVASAMDTIGSIATGMVIQQNLDRLFTKKK